MLSSLRVLAPTPIQTCAITSPKFVVQEGARSKACPWKGVERDREVDLQHHVEEREMRTNRDVEEPAVLLLTGTCGSGKSTLAGLLAEEKGWTRVSEDEVWDRLFHRDRGRIGSDEHREKRWRVRSEVVACAAEARSRGPRVVIDGTVHEGTADSWDDYDALFRRAGLTCVVRVLHPRLAVAIERDAGRPGWNAGARSVESLWRKFWGIRFGPAAFLDTSDEPQRSRCDEYWRASSEPTGPPPESHRCRIETTPPWRGPPKHRKRSEGTHVNGGGPLAGRDRPPAAEL
jgi:predicted kinase